MTSNEIVQKLLEAKKAYYEGNPIMSDQNFDLLEDVLKKVDPNNDYFTLVGTTQVAGKKVMHDVPMLSCQKAQSEGDILKWLNKISDKRIQLIMEPKIDGLSGSILYVDGKLQRIATRGTGKIGQDITHIADYLKIPKTLGHDFPRIEIRGEFYLPKDTDFPNPNNKPLRNQAVGLINRKTDRQDLKYLRFVAYQLLGHDTDKNDEATDLGWLKMLGFDVISFHPVMSMKEIAEYYDMYLKVLREKWKFETDGLVLVVNDKSTQQDIDSNWTVDHHHHYNIAYKPPAEAKLTILNGIEWQMSRQGNLIPVGILEPINIGGANISRVSLHNYKTVQDNQLREGDHVKISRSNDVIPYYIETVTHAKEDILDVKTCPYCGSTVEYEGVNAVCPGTKCDEKNIQRIVYWVEACEMDQVAESTVRSLYENGIIYGIAGLFVLNGPCLEKIDGMGKKKITNFLEQVRKTRTMSVVKFLNALGIPSVGEKAIKKMGIKSMKAFWAYKDDSSAIGASLIKYRKENEDKIKGLEVLIAIEDEKDDNSLGKVCMTGTGPKGRKELIKDLMAKGYSFIDAVTKETDILLCDDVNSGSSKLKKAQKLGVKVMSYQEFFK